MPTQAEIDKVLLINEVTEILLEFGGLDISAFTTSDYQGIAMAKAMDIIRIVKQ